MRVKMSSVKWCPFCRGLNVLRCVALSSALGLLIVWHHCMKAWRHLQRLWEQCSCLLAIEWLKLSLNGLNIPRPINLSYVWYLHYRTYSFLTILVLYSTTVTETGHISEFVLPKDTPYLTLVSELCGAYCGVMGELFLCYNGSTK